MDPLKKNQEGALANLLNKKNALKPIESISSLFSQKIPSHQEENPISSNTNMILELPPYIDENASALMNKNRAERTLFVGNIDIKATKKEIKRLFKKFGEIEAIWERSLPLNDESKIPMKAKAIVKDFSKTLTNQTKNCYILFTEKESTFKGLKANNELLLNRHLRVDLCERKENDYETSIFIGNLPYQIDEEKLRSHFSSCGEILNLRIIRDKVTHLGKGFGYLQFINKDAYKKALLLNNSIFENRNIRIRKALDPEKLEEKLQNKGFGENKLNRRNAERRLVKKDNKSFESLKNFAEVNTLEKNVLEDFEYTNIITNDRKRLLRKKIKKGLTQAEQTKIVSAADKKMTKKHDKNLFNDVDELEKRRKLRKKKEMINKKKLFTERKKTISFKKS